MESRSDRTFTSPSGHGRGGSDRGLEQAQRLVRLAQELALSADASRTAELVTLELAELAGGGVAFTYLTGADGKLVLESHAGSEAPEELERAPAVVLRAFESRAIVSADTDELAELHSRGTAAGEAIAAPIQPAGEPLGVLAVAVPQAASLGVHPGLLQTVAKLAGASLVNARRLELTLAEARRDPLTELGNHRSFHEHLEGVLRRALAVGGELTLVLFDLDDFKVVNDTEGHPAGDALLRDVARALVRHRRAREELFRVGGDEFAIVIDGGCEAGMRVAGRIRTVVGTRRDGLAITLSAGVATFPDDALTKDELVHKADLALYAAKRAGKDRAIAFGADVRGAAGRPAAEVLYEELHERMGSPDVRAGVLGALGAVTEAVRALGREQTLESLLHAAARHLSASLGATACVISRFADGAVHDEAVFAPTPWQLEAGSYLLADYPVTQEVLERGEPRAVALSDDEVDEAEAFVLRKVGMQSVLLLPVVVGGRTWGLAEVYDARERRFGPADSALAALVVGHLEALLAQFENATAVERLYRETLASLSNALEIKDDYTGQHAQEVCDLSVSVGRRLGLEGETLRAVELGALLHDIGKIRVPESILNKPGPLSDAEWALMRTHPEAGERILAPLVSLRDVLPIVRSSHERWDGRGYPDALSGESIPIGARVVAVCDAYRAMVEPRPYREALPREVVAAELAASSGTQFDPACVEALLAVLDEQERPGVIRLHRPDHLREATG